MQSCTKKQGVKFKFKGLLLSFYARSKFKLKGLLNSTITIITLFHTTSAQCGFRVWEDIFTWNKTRLYDNRMNTGAPYANFIENNSIKLLLMITFCGGKQKGPSRNGSEKPTCRLTVERAIRSCTKFLMKGYCTIFKLNVRIKIFTYSRFPLYYWIFLARIDKQKTEGAGYLLSWPMRPQFSSTKGGRLRTLWHKV